MFNLYFYPRSPCGERLILFVRHTRRPISIHALLAESDPQIFGKCCATRRFLSTLSLRRATVPEHECRRLCQNFYPRSPCGERPSTASSRGVICYFYPRSPCGERHLSFYAKNRHLAFLSTLSLRRATREPTALRTPHHIFLSTLSLRRATIVHR